ncbi:FGGY family carbohydrate kinase [Pedobacter immunditicola]|uniref:FGGY family carbohydrate kinase n=1 Tax=Pedobacter immunditicola TaxID=3133440 RepID=UPI0030AB22AB
MNYILSVDQGTSSTKTLLFDEEGKVAAKATQALNTSYYGEGFVEQQPEEIIENVLLSVKACLDVFKASGGELSAIKTCGISNQRETFVIWDQNGTPLYNAIVWQCKRSVEVCSRLQQKGYENQVREKTGLLIDPYFSGTKLIWLIENDAGVRAAMEEGRAYFGTVDTWLLFKLSGENNYYTDYTNASRTLFFNLKTLSWDLELLAAFGLSNINLPVIKPSSSHFGYTNFNGLLPAEISITAMIGDSHAAAFGEGCFSPGSAKATLGTGCSVMMNVGAELKKSGSGMVSTICWSTEERVDYGLEGVIVSCGATVEWLKNELHLFKDSRDTATMAVQAMHNNGVYLIPAFSGMGAPYWDMNRKASINGLTFGTHKNHIVRAALESIAFQIKDVITAMENDAATDLQELMVNGGITANEFVMQFLADLLAKPVVEMGMPDVSALGAAYLAGLYSGIFKDFEHLKTLNHQKHTHIAQDGQLQALDAYRGWVALLTIETSSSIEN